MSQLARTSYSQYEERIRRLLNIVGELPVELGQTMVPTIVVGDATAPGMPQWRGRRWAYATTFTAGAAWSMAWKAQAGVVITRFAVQATGVAMLIDLRVASASIADPYAITTQAGIFTERTASNSDAPPLLQSAAPAADVAIGGRISCYNTNAVPSPLVEMLRGQVMLEEGAKIQLRCPNAATPVQLVIEGYVF